MLYFLSECINNWALDLLNLGVLCDMDKLSKDIKKGTMVIKRKYNLGLGYIIVDITLYSYLEYDK